jgi:hypothetical protein
VTETRRRWRQFALLVVVVGFFGGTLIGAASPLAGAIIWLASWAIGATAVIGSFMLSKPQAALDSAHCQAVGHAWYPQVACTSCGLTREDPVVAAQYQAALEAARSELHLPRRPHAPHVPHP